MNSVMTPHVLSASHSCCHTTLHSRVRTSRRDICTHAMNLCFDKMWLVTTQIIPVYMPHCQDQGPCRLPTIA